MIKAPEMVAFYSAQTFAENQKDVSYCARHSGEYEDEQDTVLLCRSSEPVEEGVIRSNSTLCFSLVLKASTMKESLA